MAGEPEFEPESDLERALVAAAREGPAIYRALLVDAAGDWDALMGEIRIVLDRVARCGEVVDAG